MNAFVQKLGLSTVTKRRGHSYANAVADGYAYLSGMRLMPAHIAFGRCDALATNSGEPMA